MIVKTLPHLQEEKLAEVHKIVGFRPVAFQIQGHLEHLDHPDCLRDDTSDPPGGDVCLRGGADPSGCSHPREEHGEVLQNMNNGEGGGDRLTHPSIL